MYMYMKHCITTHKLTRSRNTEEMLTLAHTADLAHMCWFTRSRGKGGKYLSEF